MDLASMSDGEGWLMRPVLRQLCKYESLKNGDLDLYDMASLNEALDVEDENRARIAEAQDGG